MKKISLLVLLLLLIGLPAHSQIYTRVGALSEDFNCTIISTATVITAVTGCTPPTAGSRYITKISWSSSIISTTTNFMLISSGTGSDCAAAATSLYAGFALAFTSVDVVLPTPIKATALHGICFTHPGAGTRNVNIQGFVR